MTDHSCEAALSRALYAQPENSHFYSAFHCQYALRPMEYRNHHAAIRD